MGAEASARRAGHHRPRGGPAGRGLPAHRPHGNLVFTAGQLPVRDGEMIAIGKLGGEVTEEQGYECARQCALNALAAVKAEIGSLDDGEARRQGRRLRRLDPRLHRPAARSPTAPPSCSARSSATPASTPGRPSACPCSRSTCRSRSRSSSRSEWQRLPLPDGTRRPGPVRTPRAGHEPAEPRDAATVVLLRPGAGASAGPEVYLLRRQTSMAFAGGMCVFPGGGVDPRDFDADDSSSAACGPGRRRPSGPPGSGCDEPQARALVCAAVRETFEESGVLLAGAGADEVVADTTGDDWEADRVALESRELSMTDVPRAAVAGPAHRPARRVVGLADAGLRAAPLPHVVLRRPPARGPGHPRRLDRVVVGDVGRRDGRRGAGRAASRC